MLERVIDVRNVVFALEMIGPVRGVDPETGHHWDDTKRYIEAAGPADEDRRAILEANALRIYPRLAPPSDHPQMDLLEPTTPPGDRAGDPS